MTKLDLMSSASLCYLLHCVWMGMDKVFVTALQLLNP